MQVDQSPMTPATIATIGRTPMEHTFNSIEIQSGTGLVNPMNLTK